MAGVEPEIKGYVFHTTSPPIALKILADGYLKPTWPTGDISFTRNPWLGSSVYPHGMTFVFLEKVIKERYGGKDIEYPPFAFYRTEAEMAVKARLVYLSDCTEILTERDVARKYGYGWKYLYKDIRYRLGTPWRAFREFAPMAPWEGPPAPRIFR